MASQVQIFNLALANIGSKAQVDAPDEASNEAYYCNLFWDDARKASLREHKWNFASKYESLADLGTPVTTKWDYMYAFPSGALAIREILPRITGQPQNEYEVALNAAGSAKVILCDIDDAEVAYTSDVTEPELFDPQFVEALSWKLGSLLALPITGSVQIKQAAETMFRNVLNSALTSDGSEGQAEEAPEASWIRARLS